jgi:lysophospholipase L1-like esterase
MRSLGLGLAAAILSLAACAKDPESGGGTAGTSGGGIGGGGAAGAGGGAGSYTPPNPIVSRGAQVFSMPANGNAVVNSAYHNGGWTVPKASLPAWVAIKLAAGPTGILISWDDGGTYDYQDPPGTTVYGLVADYHFDVSSDSTNGTDGTWTAAVSPGTSTPVAVTGNAVRTRAHAIDFTGKTWIKMVITAAPANESTNGVQIGEIDVHDTSATAPGRPEDTWFFMGDSITAFAFDRAVAHQPSFAALISTATSQAYLPATINGGIGGEKTTDGLARLPDALSLNPDYHFIALSYGTNDAANSQIPPATFKSNMQSMIDMVKAAGREPVIPHIPYAGDGSHGNIPAYNAAIDELTRTNQLQVGPDLYTTFMQHPELFICPPCSHPMDNLHPNDDGFAAINKLWADAMRVVYP